ncbi:TetR/AcrR family transcriptional regulator [Micrococcus sp. Mcc89]|uniref:TetR/AcrR family transcriptional regulator n=1 Tax=Micrococcus sp. Mcc89 TaxID=2926014 RepID=UPI002118E28B|nr:TetR/AcrR family transcriptional regulator [Micrococcus sp. Mcc89]
MMVRESKKTMILDAAIQVIEEDGITAVTFDSVAAAAGITRAGIIYHFPSRDDLIAAIHQRLADRWERQLEIACGKPTAEATSMERLTAYILTCSTAASRAEFQMILDSQHTQHKAIWEDLIDRWTGRSERDEAERDQMTSLALLAGDGLWVNDLIGSRPISQDHRSETAKQIIALLQNDVHESEAKPNG